MGQVLDDFKQTAKYAALHQSTKDILDQFSYGHLSPGLIQATSEDVCGLACNMAAGLRDTRYGGELTTGLRKLLEAKDCFVRAALGTSEDKPTINPKP